MIGLLGGTFDPIHWGHLNLAVQLLGHYQFKKIYFIPAKKNPLKPEDPGASAEDRLKMVRLAVGEYQEPRLEVLDWEIRSETESFTVLTLERFKTVYSETPTLILGNEVFKDLPRWREPERILDLARLVIVTRESLPFDPCRVLKEIPTPLSKRAQQRPVESIHLPPVPVSATQLRKELRQAWRSGEMNSMPQGIQRSVWLYIKEKRLYAVTN